MANTNGDFIIQNGILLKYDGPGGNVTIPEGVKAIGYRAFSECASLIGIAIPGGVKEVGYCAFRDCTSLASVSILDGVEKIGARAFQDCTSLASVEIPGSVEEIDDRAFQDCASLASIAIPDGVKKIGEGAFAGCDRLKDARYAGTREQWGKIGIDDENDELLEAAVHFADTGKDARIHVIDGVEYIRLCDLGAFGDLLKRNLPAHD